MCRVKRPLEERHTLCQFRVLHTTCAGRQRNLPNWRIAVRSCHSSGYHRTPFQCQYRYIEHGQTAELTCECGHQPMRPCQETRPVGTALCEHRAQQSKGVDG
eukprot:2957385-Rhodomonas_salina.5